MCILDLFSAGSALVSCVAAPPVAMVAAAVLLAPPTGCDMYLNDG